MADALEKAFAGVPYTVAPDAMEKMRRFYALVSEAGQTMNLTRISSFEEAATLHFLDSASPLFHGLLPRGIRCADVGSGAGFPRHGAGHFTAGLPFRSDGCAFKARRFFAKRHRRARAAQRDGRARAGGGRGGIAPNTGKRTAPHCPARSRRLACCANTRFRW